MCFLFLLSMSFYSFHWFVHVSPRMVRLKLKNIKLFKDDMKRVRIEVSIWRVLNIIRLKAPQPFSHHQPFLYQNCVIFDLLRKFCFVGVEYWSSIFRNIRTLIFQLWVRHPRKVFFKQMLQYSFSKARFVFIIRYKTNYWYARLYIGIYSFGENVY